MRNNSELSIINNLTGEFVSDYTEPTKVRTFYNGPRTYWRVTMRYDEALLTVPSEVGIRLLTHIKCEVSTDNYEVYLGVTTLAATFKCSTKSLRNNINKLLAADHLLKLDTQLYMVNPRLFWIRGMDDTKWSNLCAIYDQRKSTTKYSV